VTTRTPKCCCLNCGALLEAATGNGRPRPGDLTACLQCGAVMLFDDDLTVRRMTQEEADLIRSDTALMDYLGRLVRTVQLLPKMN
jgi:hypothetical protein